MLSWFQKARPGRGIGAATLLLVCLSLAPLTAKARKPPSICELAFEEADPLWRPAVSERLAHIETQYAALEQDNGGIAPVRNKKDYERQLLVEGFRELRRLAQERDGNSEMLRELELAHSPELAEYRELVDARNQEIDSLLASQAPLLRAKLLHELDPPPSEKFLIEIHAEGTGLDGTVFASMLSQMYQQGAEAAGVRISVLSFKPGETQPGVPQGMESVVLAVEGPRAYEFVRHEAGKHIWKSKSLTKAQTFTTPVQVMVLPERPPTEFRLNENDYTITTKTSGGPGGQNVNKTETAVVIRHKTLPISVEMSDERSQQINRQKGMRIFTARVAQYYANQEAAQTAAARQAQLASEATVRTYRNVDPTKVVDERTGESYPYADVLSGESLGNFQSALDARRLEQLLLSNSPPNF